MMLSMISQSVKDIFFIFLRMRGGIVSCYPAASKELFLLRGLCSGLDRHGRRIRGSWGQDYDPLNEF